MKKFLRRLRLWLLDRLGGVDMCKAVEWEARAEAKANEYYKGQITYYRDAIADFAEKDSRLRDVIREICRRSENSYYDWCCEYCTAECSKRNGWCSRFDV